VTAAICGQCDHCGDKFDNCGEKCSEKLDPSDQYCDKSDPYEYYCDRREPCD